MVDISILKSEIFGLVGSRQTVASGYDLLPASLLESRSGQFVQSEHPILTVENLDQCARNYANEIYDDWDVATTYIKGDRVADGGTNYEYISDTPTAGNLTSDVAFWSPVSDFANYLIRRQEDAIQMVMQSVIREKKLKSLTKSIYENVLLYDGQGSLTNKEINQGKFVGFEITLKNHRSLITVINAIRTQLTGLVTFNIYLFHSSQPTALSTFQITNNQANGAVTTKLTASNIMRYLDDSYDIGGSFYLGYFQADLSGSGVQAINKDVNLTKAPCGSCNKRNAYYYNSYSQFMSICAIEVPASALNGTNLFDIDQVGYSYDKTYGLNLNLTTRCDITDFVVQEEYLLSDAVAKQWAVLLLEDIAYNTRDNSISEKVRQSAVFELNNRERGSLPYKLDKAIKAVDYDFSSLNDACLPCNDEFGITWGNM